MPSLSPSWRSSAPPILSSTFIRPGQEEPETNGWEVEESLGHLIDVVIEGPVGQGEPTTVVDLTDDVPEVVREGAGDISCSERSGCSPFHGTRRARIGVGSVLSP